MPAEPSDVAEGPAGPSADTAAIPRRGTGVAVLSFFGLKMVLGATILVASARWLSVGNFAVFSQLLVLIAYLATIGTAGVQTGLIRQIAAAENDDAVAREVRAAFSIWAVLALIVCLGSWLFATPIARFLTGFPQSAWVVPWLAVLAVLTGLGQLLCSVLTGTDRASASLFAQGVGLVAGTIPALALLRWNMPNAAALLFSGGQSVTLLIAAARIRRVLGQAVGTPGSVMPEIRRLLGFSGAFLLVASIMPLTLLELRAIYRSTLGLEALGYWLAANRISDVNTQLMGLYMVQVFLPGMTAARGKDTAWRLVRHTFFVATTGMATGLIIFLLAPSLLVGLFLSAKFLPAVPLVIGYFLGDTLRASASLASYTAMSQRRLVAYVGFEAAAAALIAASLMLLLHFDVPNAPAIAYVGSYILMAIVAWRFIAKLLGRSHAAAMPAGMTTD